MLSLLYTHLAHTDSLNETCNALRVHESEFMRNRGARPPARNTLSNANRTRVPAMAEALYWAMLDHLGKICPSFTAYRRHTELIFRMKRGIFAMDSTTLQLTLVSIDWARHRRRKAAAKCHMRLNSGTFLPTIAVVEDAVYTGSITPVIFCCNVSNKNIWAI